jgi:hypothetical protein
MQNDVMKFFGGYFKRFSRQIIVKTNLRIVCDIQSQGECEKKVKWGDLTVWWEQVAIFDVTEKIWMICEFEFWDGEEKLKSELFLVRIISAILGRW